MHTIEIVEAEKQLSRLVDEAVNGTTSIGWAKKRSRRCSEWRCEVSALLAQALTEGITLLTADDQFVRYSGPVRRI
ncbi:MAG: hypothetical protein WB973_10320 [Thermoanaerobaculia bacterium]